MSGNKVHSGVKSWRSLDTMVEHLSYGRELLKGFKKRNARGKSLSHQNFFGVFVDSREECSYFSKTWSLGKEAQDRKTELITQKLSYTIGGTFSYVGKIFILVNISPSYLVEEKNLKKNPVIYKVDNMEIISLRLFLNTYIQAFFTLCGSSIHSFHLPWFN